jgi:hypothetical protein
VHVEESTLRIRDEQNRIDPQKWNPLIMRFGELFGLSAQLTSSQLASRPEKLHAAVP